MGTGTNASGYVRALTIWIWCRLNYVEKLHIGDVINVDLNLEDDDERLPVELDGENRGREEKLADHRLSLCVWRGDASDVGSNAEEKVPQGDSLRACAVSNARSRCRRTTF